MNHEDFKKKMEAAKEWAQNSGIGDPYEWYMVYEGYKQGYVEGFEDATLALRKTFEDMRVDDLDDEE